MSQGKIIEHKFYDAEGKEISLCRHDLHGKELHNIALFIVEMICVDKKHKFINMGNTLKEKHFYPGQADCITEYKWSRSDSNGHKTRGVSRCIFEMETDATLESIAKKRLQFDVSLKGYELVIIPINFCKDTKSWLSLYNFIDGYITEGD